MSTPLQVSEFGPLDALYAAIRRRIPQVLVAHIRAPEEYVRVTYRSNGPADLVWNADGREYCWAAGADPNKYVGTDIDIEEAVQNVAALLGAVTTPLT